MIKCLSKKQKLYLVLMYDFDGTEHKQIPVGIFDSKEKAYEVMKKFEFDVNEGRPNNSLGYDDIEEGDDYEIKEFNLNDSVLLNNWK